MKTGFFAVVAYFVASVAFFGGPFRALGLLLLWGDRGLPYGSAVLLALAIALLATHFAERVGVPRFLYAAIFISVSIASSAVMVGTYAEIKRGYIVEKFKPDVEIRRSIFASFRNAPRDFQFFLHGAALKDCRPYAWSYRRMEFYELSPSVAPNVLPSSWVKECKIGRTH